MGRFLDEAPVQYKPKGRFLDGPGESIQDAKPRVVGNLNQDIIKFGARKLMEMNPAIRSDMDVLEKTSPMAGQIVGGLFGGYPGSIAGATGGQAVSQAVKAVRGDSPVDLSAIPKEAAITATIEGLMRGAGKIAKPIAGRLMNSALRPETRLMMKGKNLGLEAAEAGYMGTKKGMLKQATGNVGKFESELQDVLKKSGKEADVSSIYSKLEGLKKNYFGNKAAVQAIDDMKEAIALEVGTSGKLPIQKANELKRSLYSQIKPSQYGTAEVPHMTDIRKTSARAFKEGIEKAEPSVGPINKKLGLAGSVRDALEKQAALEQRQVVLPFFEVGGAGAAMMYGHPEYAALIAGRRLGNTALAKSAVAQALINAAKQKAIGRGLTLGASNVVRDSNQQ